MVRHSLSYTDFNASLPSSLKHKLRPAFSLYDCKIYGFHSIFYHLTFLSCLLLYKIYYCSSLLKKKQKYPRLILKYSLQNSYKSIT